MTISKRLKSLYNRPATILSYLRQYFLFACTRILLLCRGNSLTGVVLGPGVLIQKLSSILVERSDATLAVGAHSIIYENCRIEVYGSGKCTIGQGSILGEVRILCRQKITIGDKVLISWGVYIQDYDPHPVNPEERSEQMEGMYSAVAFWSKDSNKVQKSTPLWNFPSAEIRIGDNVWIGMRAIILKGVSIGSNSVVAAGSVVVAGEYPERCILAGNPAKIVRILE